MKRWIKVALPVLMLVGAVVAVVLMVAGRPAPERREPPETAMMVDTIAVEPTTRRFQVSSQGTVRARTRTSLVAEVSGRIVELSDNFVAGGFFEAGETLARIDPSDYETALLRARAELASAEARKADEQAQSDQARRDWERLHGTDREPGPLVLRLPQLQDAEAAVKAAEADVQRAERDLERTRIQLPYDGLVIERETDLGQFVSSGTTLGQAFAVDSAEVRLPLSNRDMAFLDLPRPGFRPEEPVRVQLSGSVSGRAAFWDAEIVRTEAVVEEATRLTHAVARIQDPYGIQSDRLDTPLPVGTFVNARIEGRPADGLIALPRRALRENNRLYIADADDRLAIREVDVVRTTPDQVYVSNSLERGDRVITTSVQTPIPGLNLRVRDTAPAVNAETDEPVLRVLPLESEDAGGEGEDS